MTAHSSQAFPCFGCGNSFLFVDFHLPHCLPAQEKLGKLGKTLTPTPGANGRAATAGLVPSYVNPQGGDTSPGIKKRKVKR